MSELNKLPGHVLDATLRLSYRDKRIIELLAEGMTTEEIAAELSFAPRTIKLAIHKLITGLQVKNRVHLVVFAVKYGIIKL